MSEGSIGRSALRLAGQVLAYAAFVGAVAYLSAAPAYEHLPQGQALIRLSISHPGQIVGECRRLTAAELARLAPNMRQSEICPRERSPLHVRVEVDNRPLYDEILAPKGLKRDGTASTYRAFAIAAGAHRVRALVSDSTRIAGFNYEREAELSFEPGQALTIDFNATKGGVLFL